MAGAAANSGSSSRIPSAVLGIRLVEGSEANAGRNFLLIGDSQKVLPVRSILNKEGEACAEARILLFAGNKKALQPETSIKRDEQ